MPSIILNGIRSCFRSGSVVFFTILFPSLITFILGTFLEKIEVSDSVVGELNIAYCVENGGYSADTFEEFILTLEEENVITSAKKLTSSELENLSENYSAAVELLGTEIVIHNGTNAVQNRTVKALIDSYDQTAAAYMTVAQTNPQALANIELSEEGYVQPHDFGRTRSMMDYYAVAMAVLIAFFGSCIGGASTYGNEYTFKTIDRLTTAPLNKTAIYFGKIIGNMPIALLETGTVMIVSSLFFGAHYCATFAGNMLLFTMLTSASLALLALGVLLNLIFPRLPSQAVLNPVIWVMMYFSGVFQKDQVIEGFSEYLPPRIVLNAAFDLTVFSRSDKAVSVTIWSLAIFAVLIIIGCVKVNSRRKNT